LGAFLQADQASAKRGGTQQGGPIIRLMLSNEYLHYVGDLWFNTDHQIFTDLGVCRSRRSAW
jgi:hypothetical protein